MLDVYAGCRLCGVDLKVSTRGLATHPEHVWGKNRKLQDSASRCPHQKPLLTENGVERTLCTVESRLRLLEGRPVPVIEIATEVSVERAVEIERDRGLV